MINPLDIREHMLRWLDGPEFYNLMQDYRHAPVHRQKDVMDAYDAIKRAILMQTYPVPPSPASPVPPSQDGPAKGESSNVGKKTT